MRHLEQAVLLFAFVAALLGNPAVTPAQVPTETAAQSVSRTADFEEYQEAREKARAWFDQLEVDAVDLLANNVKGKKKVAEILGVYMNFLRNTSDPQETAAIMERVESLTEQTRRAEYHNLATCSERELIENSMSYLRVMLLMQEFGLDTTYYRDELLKVQPRIDAHLARRGPWQRAMFAEYYDMFGLEKPALLENVEMQEGVIARRLPAGQYDQPFVDQRTGRIRVTRNSYELTHEVFVAYNYGLQKTQNKLSAEDVAYTRQVLPVLVRRYIQNNDPDLLAELLSSMTYLGFHDDPAYREGLDFLLAGQNPNGTWGSYERFRPRYGKYLDQNSYLHTTMVAMRALMEAYEGDWPAAN